MKKIIVMLVCGLAANFVVVGEHCRSFMDNGLKTSNKKENVIPLSSSEWNYVKNTVDTNGWCKIPNCDISIVITNVLGEVGHNLPLFLPMAETYHPDKKTEKVGKEPLPYQN